jgi:hypothetical protein
MGAAIRFLNGSMAYKFPAVKHIFRSIRFPEHGRDNTTKPQNRPTILKGQTHLNLVSPRSVVATASAILRYRSGNLATSATTLIVNWLVGNTIGNRPATCCRLGIFNHIAKIIRLRQDASADAETALAGQVCATGREWFGLTGECPLPRVQGWIARILAFLAFFNFFLYSVDRS